MVGVAEAAKTSLPLSLSAGGLPSPCPYPFLPFLLPFFLPVTCTDRGRCFASGRALMHPTNSCRPIVSNSSRGPGPTCQIVSNSPRAPGPTCQIASNFPPAPGPTCQIMSNFSAAPGPSCQIASNFSPAPGPTCQIMSNFWAASGPSVGCMSNFCLPGGPCQILAGDVKFWWACQIFGGPGAPTIPVL